MNIKSIYMIIGAVIIAAVVFIILSKEPDKSKADPLAGLPPGHPPINEMQPSPDDMKNGRTPAGGTAPSKENVRSDFMNRLKDLRERVSRNDKDTSGVLELARMLSDSHQFKEAAGLYERFLKADRKNTVVMLDLSVCYFNLSQIDDAARVTSMILKNEPSNTVALYNLGAIHATQGQKEKAKEVWNNLIKKYPGSEDAARAKESLGKL